MDRKEIRDRMKLLGLTGDAFQKYYRLVNGDVEELEKIATMSRSERAQYTIQSTGGDINYRSKNHTPQSEWGPLYKKIGEGVVCRDTFRRYFKFLKTEQAIKEFLTLSPQERNLRLRGHSRQLGYKSKEDIKRDYKNSTTKEYRKKIGYEKTKQTLKARYGSEHYNNVEKINDTKRRNLEIARKVLEEKYSQQMFSITELAEELGITTTPTLKLLQNLGIQSEGYRGTKARFIRFEDFQKTVQYHKRLGERGVSALEKELRAFVEGLGVRISKNDRTVLKGKELDIYCPDYKTAIEFNGAYYHSDAPKYCSRLFPTIEEERFAKIRHLEKTVACEEKGIRLIHVFEDDWLYQKDIVKSILRLAFGKPVRRIYARKCKVSTLTPSVYKDFLNENHLQGYSAADIKLGLFFEGELVECIGVKTKGTHSSEPELVRLCTLKDTQVVGGFSKLLKRVEVTTLISYIDRATFSGLAYSKIGWSIEKVNPPAYFYVKNASPKRLPRTVARGNNLRKLIQVDPSLTEKLNMYKNRYYRIWNCGTIKVRLTLPL